MNSLKGFLNFFRERWPLLVAFILIFFFFEQYQDLDFTARVSMNFYSVNPLHLYDEAAKFAYVGSPGNINYMPSTYILFAIWGLPLKILGLISDPSQDVGYAIFWYKLLPTLFFFGCALFIQKIANEFLKDEKLSEKVACLWLVSPFAFFSQFVFGQYDSFTLFFTLWGIYAFLQKKLLKFSLLLGVAITFKYFPLFVFFPMLFVVEKNFKVILKNTLLFGIPIACVAGPYLAIDSPEFARGVLGFGAANRVSGVNMENGGISYNFLLFAWGIVCGYVYFFENKASEWKETAIKFGGLGVLILFILVYWHPQWLMFISPFLLLNFMYRERFRDYLIFQMILNVVLIATMTQIFGFNVDQNMLKIGLLGKWFPQFWNGVMIARVGNIFVPHDQRIWLALFNSLLVINLVFTFRNFKSTSAMVTAQDFSDNEVLINQYTWFSVALLPVLCLGAYLMTVMRWFSIHS
jgi:hypothetical protein